MARLFISLSGKQVKRPSPKAVAKAKKVLRKKDSADAADEKSSLQDKIAQAKEKVKGIQGRIKDLDAKHTKDSAKRKKAIDSLESDMKAKMEQNEAADAHYRARQAKLQADLKTATMKLNGLNSK